jgi:NAD+ diphosphatase
MSAADEIAAVPSFTGMALDRASAERKDPAWVHGALDHPAARVIAADQDGVLVGDGDAPALQRAEVGAQPRDEPILLGLDDGNPLFATDLEVLSDAARAALTNGSRVVALREAGTLLSHPEAGLAAYVVALLNWHRRHRFCANCGTRTDVREAGYARQCPNCGVWHFPRTDPVVIMTVVSDGRLLLGRRAGWPAGRLSVLAGFVAPGESLEEAVVREVEEESGIVAYDPVFVASQPWPFPMSLMLGFHAQAHDGDPRATDGELEEVQWLDLESVRASARGEDVGFALPPPVSIARFLIDRWIAAAD